MDAKSISEMIYRSGKIHFFYEKIHKEIETVRKIGIDLISNIDFNAMGEWLKIKTLLLLPAQDFKLMSESIYLDM